MSRGMTRANRLKEMERLYLERAFSDIEMARRMGVDRTIIHRDRKEMEANYVPFVEEPPGKYRINRRSYLSNVRLNIREALSLYLAARRASQQTRMGQQPMANALEKLSLAMRQPMTERLVKSAEAILAAHIRPQQEKVFEAVAHAWVDGLRLRVLYQGLSARKPYRDRISPYLIEPSSWSDAVYVIGPSDVFDGIVTYRLDRMLEARISTEPFIIPDDFDEDTLLRYAWGVWRGEGEPQEVVLRFAPGPAARRVQESVWHPLQELVPMEDGGVLWRAPIAQWREMLPWIRGWGADVEVLEPIELRDRLRSESQRLAAIYLSDEEKAPAWFKLWAKAKQDEGLMHPLIYHLLDVGMTAEIMWREVLSEGERTQVAELLQMDVDQAGALFAFLIATHDLGKASPSFQEKVPFARPILEKAGFDFPPSQGLRGAPHGVVTAWALPDLLQEHLGLSTRDARRIAHAVGGHHGVWPTDRAVREIRSYDKGGQAWDNARAALVKELLEIFKPPTPVSLPVDTEDRNALLMFLSGFTTAADWLGSMDEYFEYEPRFMTAERYAEIAAETARQALKETGWMGWKSNDSPAGFTDVFPFTPNAMQQALFDAALDSDLPALVILEAPTGGGKTEAALYLADSWMQRDRGKGMYIAMPTQATSNQMFNRTKDFLQNRYPHMPVQLHLVHGNAAWMKQTQTMPLIRVGETVEEGVIANAWFLPRKRTLLAPFGVGTVDQSFLSVLQTRHFFLRLFGLSHKVLVFDEVHAYDTYMSQLFLRLLTWLRTMGTSVIVLSATLPESTRREMISAWTDAPAPTEAAPYPRFTLVTERKVKTLAIPKPASRTIELTWAKAEEIVALLEENLVEGGCAAVICNTVGRAQEVYEALCQARLVDAEYLTLFHARMPFAWRKKIEEQVLRAFGKPDAQGQSPQRPHKAIVVATQVIEQSLDLDFDLMITELAPVDLVIQRVGRLHRHARKMRPAPLRQPRAILLKPQGTLSSPDFGSSHYIYGDYLLWQTWLALLDRTILTIPDDTLALMNAVYGEFHAEVLPEDIRGPMQKAYEDMLQSFHSDASQAERRLVPGPEAYYLVTRPQDILGEDENPNVHEQLRAVTRLIGPTLSLVCLHRTPDGLFLEPDGSGPRIDLDAEPPRYLIKDLMQHTVTIQRRDLINKLKDKLPHKSWKTVAALRYSLPVIFENGVYRTDDNSLTLTLDRDYGLRIIKEAK